MRKTGAALVVAAVALLAPLALLPFGAGDAPATEAQTVPGFRDVAAWEAPPYAEDFTGPCRPRLPRTVVRHDLLALALEPCPLPSTTLTYGAPSTTGTITDDGDYAFLSNPDDLSTAVTTYEGLRDGSTTGLVLHQNDSAGTSQADFYDTVRAGDIVEWREANDCFVRYPVTEVKDDPTGDLLRKLLAVKVMTYAFTGCSGTISTTGRRTITWSPANLRSPDMVVPIRHGPWQLMPSGWLGERENSVLVPITPTPPSSDPAVVRQHRLWRDPAIPADWRLLRAGTGEDGTDGVQAFYVNARGTFAIRLSIRQLGEIGGTVATTTVDPADFTVEGRIIDGHPAFVEYSPTDNKVHSTGVLIYDETTGVQYYVSGMDPSLRGANVEATIAIARSLYREAP